MNNKSNTIKSQFEITIMLYIVGSLRCYAININIICDTKSLLVQLYRYIVNISRYRRIDRELAYTNE